MGNQPLADTWQRQIQVRRRVIAARNWLAITFAIGFIAFFGWIALGATNGTTHAVPNDWIWRLGWIAFGLLAGVPLIFMIVMAVQLREYLKLERITGRVVTAADSGERENTLARALSAMRSGRWRWISLGIFVVVVAYKVVRSLIG